MSNNIERFLYYLIEKIFPKSLIILNDYYFWLKSPKNYPLQLDFYLPTEKLAIEYQAPQHYKFNKKYHKSQAGFRYCKRCDQIKQNICRKKDISLIQIKFDEIPLSFI